MDRGHRAQNQGRTPFHIHLQDAVMAGSVESVVAILSSGHVDIDDGGLLAVTPLMLAAQEGHSLIAKILVHEGANLAAVMDDGTSALAIAAGQGHLGVTKVLIEAGARLDSKSLETRQSPLHVAADRGYTEVVRALLEAGANPDSLTREECTPLYFAAVKGHMDTVRALLREKANPLLAWRSPRTRTEHVPLEAAAQEGHSKVVRELIQRFEVIGCGVPSGGVDALCAAVRAKHADVVKILMEAGVVDTGTRALVTAVTVGSVESVRLLLQRQPANAKSVDSAAYEDCEDARTEPLMRAVCYCQPKIVRLFLDAGTDTGFEISDLTPLAFTMARLLEQKSKNESGALAEAEIHDLEAMRRLLSQEEAIHALSWSWPGDAPFLSRAARSTTAAGMTRTTGAFKTEVLPTTRWKARADSTLSATLFRFSSKP